MAPPPFLFEWTLPAGPRYVLALGGGCRPAREKWVSSSQDLRQVRPTLPVPREGAGASAGPCAVTHERGGRRAALTAGGRPGSDMKKAPAGARASKAWGVA